MKLAKIFSSFISREEKNLRMVWEVSKKDRVNYLIGTAHFSPYHYRKSLRHFIKRSAKVIFEGPLDEKNRQQVVIEGMQRNGTDILKALDEQTALKLRKLVADLFVPQKAFSNILSWPSAKDQFSSEFFQERSPWLAFFQIWAHFLKSHGWIYSVDLEAFQIAKKLNKEIIFLETIEEQVAGLEGIPIERIINFLKKIDLWSILIENYAQHYATGKIEALLKVTQDFPTRCAAIVDKRDPIMYDRLRPIFAQGLSVALVGTVHLPGLLSRFRQDNYEVHQILNPET